MKEEIDVQMPAAWLKYLTAFMEGESEDLACRDKLSDRSVLSRYEREHMAEIN